MPAMSELETIGYEQGMQDMHNYVIKSIKNTLENPQLDIIPTSMALRILLASLSDLDQNEVLRTN